MGVTARAYGRHRGVSHVAVLKALRDGRIEVNADGLIDPAAADAAWVANTTPRRAKARRSGSPTAAESHRVLLAAKAARERLRLDVERGKLIDAATAHSAAFTAGRRVRDGLVELQQRLPAILAAETDPRAIAILLEAEHRRLLSAFATEFRSHRVPERRPVRRSGRAPDAVEPQADDGIGDPQGIGAAG